jgi:chemotaxis protein MotB
MTDAQNESGEDTQHHEIVIIRRRGGGDEAPHKGGVWKIAHADFMTALMAFFLVMWLITATDDKTVTGIANYFNPMRLSDSTTRPKGVFTMDPGDEQDDSEDDSEEGVTKPVSKPGARTGEAAETKKYTETALFADPYKALDDIAAEAGKAPPVRAVTEQGNVPAHRTGDAFRDPFDPDIHYGPPRRGEVGGEAGNQGTSAGNGAKNGSGKGDLAKSKVGSGREGKGDTPQEKLAQMIDEAIAQSGFSATPGVEVEATRQGLLVSITDQADFEMFGIASAQPKPELVVLMEKIGSVLAGRTEKLVIRGHTDGRPFRSKDYDNWRLSTARANMANYMLLRAGLDQDRVDRIEGHADHDLKVEYDPLAAENRRIEILLVKEET